ncbi:OLC1v1001165C1 [Oldenlandia corymbosa var. corymbosa]|uniref:OLC1v1001165C1 n=1 Tax=Oldenlandia corymbosa var. corymbosa TaxID=529605 RepID=A0AAV1D4Q3_OLDCO|nr:OLC1v1001165C1 [Oldenlandia corymbosa var. corymbosa]
MEEGDLLSSEQNHKLKRDPIWQYGSLRVTDKGKKLIICNFCGKSLAGGGVNRLKHHLGKVKGNVAPCKKVPPDVCSLAAGLLQDNVRKSKEKRADFEIESDDVQEIPKVFNEISIKGKRKAEHGIEGYMSENLCNLFAEIVDMVGKENVIHLVTDNAANYKVAGRLLSERYPLISWSPCAAHCVNLIMKDIGSMPKIVSLITLASRVTVFVYNRKWILSWLRKIPGWKEIVHPAETRFGTTFIALKILYDHRVHLESLVLSQEYKVKELKHQKGKDVKETVLNEKFWNNCLVTVKIMGPLMRLLRICDCDERSSLGYVYDGLWRAINAIKNLFNNNKKLYEPYTQIIDNRWDSMLKKDLHAAAFWLNPTFQYEVDNRGLMSEAWKGLMNVMEKFKIECSQDVMNEVMMFRSQNQSFGCALAKKTYATTSPGKTRKFVILDEEDDGDVDIGSSSFFEVVGNEDSHDGSDFVEPRVFIGNEYDLGYE